jgi:hypothetical protein
MPDDIIETETAPGGMGLDTLHDASAVTETPAGTQPVAEATPAQVLYVGPRLQRPFPVGSRTIFRGALPAPLAKAVAADADLAALFVPVAETGSALRAVTQQGSALCRAAAAVSDKYLTRKEG